MELVTLRRMCELLNVSRRSIQCYEKAGLLVPTEKNKYGHLLYDSKALHRAERIKFFQEIGFKLREIKEIIDASPEDMKTVLERRVKELQKEKERTDILIEEVYRFIEQLKL